MNDFKHCKMCLLNFQSKTSEVNTAGSSEIESSQCSIGKFWTLLPNISNIAISTDKRGV